MPLHAWLVLAILIGTFAVLVWDRLPSRGLYSWRR